MMADGARDKKPAMVERVLSLVELLQDFYFGGGAWI